MGDFYRFDKSLFVEEHPVDARNAVVGIGFAERPSVIHHVPGVLSGHVDDGMMTGTRSNFGVLLQHFTDALKRAKGRIGNGLFLFILV